MSFGIKKLLDEKKPESKNLVELSLEGFLLALGLSKTIDFRRVETKIFVCCIFAKICSRKVTKTDENYGNFLNKFSRKRKCKTNYFHTC